MLQMLSQVFLWMFQKAAKTADKAPRQKSQPAPAKQRRVDTGASGDGRTEKSFDLGGNVFSKEPSFSRHSAASAAARVETKTVSRVDTSLITHHYISAHLTVLLLFNPILNLTFLFGLSRLVTHTPAPQI